jgi:adenylate cyclase
MPAAGPGPLLRRARQAGILPALLLGVAVSLGVTLLSQVGALAGWETRAVDAFQFLRDREPAPEIVLVLIDDDAFRELGERQPLSRRFVADLADFLLQNGARVVALDILLQAPSLPEEDAVLVAAGARWRGRVVLAREAVQRADGRGWDLRPHFSPALDGPSGFVNAPVEGDGVVRRFDPVLPASGGAFHASFALAAVAAAASAPPANLAAALGAGPAARVALPTADAGGRLGPPEPLSLDALASDRWRISYAGAPGTLVAFPAGPLVSLARSGQPVAADNPFRHRLVVVGGTFAMSRDFYRTPTGLMPGVEIQGNAMHTLLARRALLPPPWWLNAAMLFGTCLAVAALSLWLRPAWAALASLALVAGIAAVSYEAYRRGGYWLDFVAPAAAMLAYQQGARVVARRRLRSAFGQYVSPEVMARVLRSGAALGGELREVSVLVSDLRGFTTLCERLAPAEVTEAMNEYLTAMVDRILAHRGMVSDFIGDGILAFFGAPLDDPDHAWHAVQTALEMQAALEALNARWAREGKLPLAMGVAVNTGPAFAGTIGAPRKKKFALLGDTVNTAARIEGLNRQLETRILAGPATVLAVGDRIVATPRGRLPVKGKAEPIEVFEVHGLAAGPAPGRARAGSVGTAG